MKYVVYGAGGIGGVVGGRLHQAGFATRLIARGEHARIMRAQGLRLVSPAGVEQIPVAVVEHPRQLNFDRDTVVLLCMKSQQTLAALQALAVQPGARLSHVVCMQNGVANEGMALRYFDSTYGTVVNLPASYLTPGEVVTHAEGLGGILDTGCYPSGADAVAEEIAADLSTAGFSARPDPHIMRQKYAKLLSNLGNILQACLHDSHNMQSIHRQLRAEALACYQAAGIDCASREETRSRRQGVYQMGHIAGFARTGGSSWQSLARGTGDIETEYLNGEICLLGRQFDVATPANRICVQVSREIIANGDEPGQYSAGQLQRRIDQEMISRKVQGDNTRCR